MRVTERGLLMIALIVVFTIIEILTAGHFYSVGRSSTIEELDRDGLLCDEWYKLKNEGEKS
jgi:hypothetical protein